jgi:hypothetical protein
MWTDLGHGGDSDIAISAGNAIWGAADLAVSAAFHVFAFGSDTIWRWIELPFLPNSQVCGRNGDIATFRGWKQERRRCPAMVRGAGAALRLTDDHVSISF